MFGVSIKSGTSQFDSSKRENYLAYGEWLRLKPKKLLVNGGIISLAVIMGVILLLKNYPVRNELIKEVSLAGVVGDREYGRKIGEENFIVPPPWRTRFKIVLNDGIFNLLPAGDLVFDSTLIHFRGSDPDTKIKGFNFHFLSDEGFLLADFMLPEVVSNWNFQTDSIVLVIQVRALPNQALRANIEASSITREKSIKKEIYDPTSKASFSAEVEDGHTRHSLPPSTPIMSDEG